ncbi:hypothetical protein DFH07DRAFT_802662 [Mycena maculata]|uniref:Transmembrane protein n=1 Tax=Mycena maculata TaxID=230809 RepID=A0AAD7NSD3_9AGAR|nr:hypothetical protein DFH07DRAFT_802662 [Mycena maculata]
MALNLTIDDSSPLISYGPSGAWQDASSNDTAGLSYFGNSLHSTTAPGATATINFNGTGISIFGGFRPEYGTYTVAVDGKTVEDGTATAPGIETEQLIGGVVGLANGPHTAVVTSTGVGMDIDAVILNTEVGSVGSTLSSTLYDDTSPAVTYAGAWDTSDAAEYINGTLHFSQATGAAASLPFTGNAVAVWGTVSPQHANIQISVDGNSVMVNGGSNYVSELHAQTLLYWANDLDPSQQHMLIMTNPGAQNGTGPFIDLDAITVYSSTGGAATPQPSAITNQASGNDQSNHSNSRSGLSQGAMIGIIAASVVAILVFLGLLLLLFLRKRKRSQRLTGAEPKTPTGAELPLQGPNMRFRTPTSPLQPMPTFSSPVLSRPRTSMHSIAPSYYASNDTFRASVDSTTPMVPTVPTLAMPRVPSRAQRGVMMPNRGGPDRPSRPPSLDLPDR